MKYIFSLAIFFLFFLPVYSQVGKVGINTTTPSAMLHVKDSSVLFTGIPTLPITPGNPPVIGAGTRMMWYPDKAAFRVGRVSDASWDKDSIGNYSFAAGQNVKAKGNFSAAFGNTSTAIGVSSFATGFASQANGDFSVAMGYASEASGVRSIAMGSSAVSNGDSSLAIGKDVTASGLNSISIGTTTIASGSYSMAAGYLTTASGISSTAVGRLTNATGDGSTAMGFLSSATGGGAIAIGNSSTASANYAMALGELTTASGVNSTSMGKSTVAKGVASTAMGFLSSANGDYTTAMGSLTIANGSNATAMGLMSSANGNVTTVQGLGTVARAFGSVATGIFNDSIATSSTTNYITTDPIFIIGNGTSNTSRSNALTILKNGNTGIGVISPNEKLEVSGKTVTTNFQMTSGAAVNTILQGNAGGNASWSNSPSITTLNSVNVNATYYNYLGPQTRYFNIPASGFQLMPVNGTSTAGLSSSTINGGQTLLTGTAGVISRFEAPIYLPEDAVIKSILLYVRDASGSYEVSADLIEANALTQTIVASVPGTGVAATPNDTNISVTGLNIVTDKFLSYFLRFNTIEFNGNLRVYNGRITYTVDKAD